MVVLFFNLIVCFVSWRSSLEKSETIAFRLGQGTLRWASRIWSWSWKYGSCNLAVNLSRAP